jgi:hypothetical protein
MQGSSPDPAWAKTGTPSRNTATVGMQEVRGHPRASARAPGVHLYEGDVRALLARPPEDSGKACRPAPASPEVDQHDAGPARRTRKAPLGQGHGSDARVPPASQSPDTRSTYPQGYVFRGT